MVGPGHIGTDDPFSTFVGHREKNQDVFSLSSELPFLTTLQAFGSKKNSGHSDKTPQSDLCDHVS